MIKNIKQGDIAVSQNDFGLLVEEFVQNELRRGGGGMPSEWMDEYIRKWWPLIEKYYQRQIISAIELAIALDKPPRYNRQELQNKKMWEQIVKDLRPARSAFSVKYECSKCKQKNVKLWRDSHTFTNYVELECATCLAPDVKVDAQGMSWYESSIKDSTDMLTDNLKNKLPAIPVDDTYWGYSSSPSQDVEWWKNLPTYPKKE